MYVTQSVKHLRDVKRQYSTRSDLLSQDGNITPGIQPPDDEAQRGLHRHFAHTDKFAVLTFRDANQSFRGAPDVRTGLPFLK